MSRKRRSRARQHVPQTACAVPEPERVDLLAQANKIARDARAQGYQCIVDCGDARTPYKPHISIEIWEHAERDS